MLRNVLLAALMVAGSAQAQVAWQQSSATGREGAAMESNKRLIDAHSLATLPKSGFMTHLLDYQCPSVGDSQGGGEPGNIALTTNALGYVLLSGCYLITRDGDVNITWENGRTAYYRRESVKVTPYGRRMQSAN